MKDSRFNHEDRSTLGPSVPEPSLRGLVVKGAGWAFAGNILSRALALVQMVVLARVLEPGDFGLFGIVVLAIVTVETFSQTGFQKALIQQKGNAQDYLDTAWTVQLLRGLLLALILFIAAPAVAWFFEEPRTISLLRVLCFSLAINGFVNIGIIYFQKDLTFHKQFVYDLVPQAVSLVVAIILVYQIRSVWALIWAGMVQAVTQCLFSYAVHNYRPRIRFDKSRAAELFRFGGWLLGSSILLLLVTQGDNAFLGKLLGAGALGLYQMAYRLSNVPLAAITQVANTVMFPAFARAQDQPMRLRRAFLPLLEVIVALSLPFTLFMALAAPEIVLGLLGAKWQDAIMPLRILAVASFLRILAATGVPLFIGTGRPKTTFWMNLARVLVIALTIYPLTVLLGIAGTSLSVVLCMAATLPLWARALSVTGISRQDLLERCLPAGVLSLLVWIGIHIGRSLPSMNIQVTLLWECFVGTLLYGLGGWLYKQRFHKGPFSQAAEALAAIKDARKPT